jgi:hypothetical protein
MYIGDFILTKESKNPGLIIKDKLPEMSNNLLVSITEYGGDYIILKKNEVKKITISPISALYILANYGNWFYEEHSNIFNEKIINFANDYIKLQEK